MRCSHEYESTVNQGDYGFPLIYWHGLWRMVIRTQMLESDTHTHTHTHTHTASNFLRLSACEIKFMCLLGWAIGPRDLVKHYSGCFYKGGVLWRKQIALHNVGEPQ
jgi:hypothetical protein